MTTRLTKATLRRARITLTQTVNDVFKLSDERLKAYVEAGMPGITITETSREELLRMAIHWAIDQAIPDQMTY